MITIISGTNRPDSNTLKVATSCMQLLEKQGLDSKILSLEELPADVTFSDLYGKRSVRFQQIIDEYIVPVNYFIMIVPEYNGSFPGIVKVFLDAVPPELNRGKKIALIGVSSGRAGNIRGMEHLTGICNYLGMFVHHNKPAISNILSLIDEQGNFTDTKTIGILEKLISDFNSW